MNEYVERLLSHMEQEAAWQAKERKARQQPEQEETENE